MGVGAPGAARAWARGAASARRLLIAVLVASVLARPATGASADFSSAQQASIALTPKATAFLSMLGSCFIIMSVRRRQRSSLRVYHRLLCAMSVMDVMVSSWFFLSSWPIPRGTDNIWAPKGTTGACTAQGYFIQLGLAVPFYNASLSLLYVLSIKHSWSEARLRGLEPLLHAVALGFPLATATAGLFLELFNSASLWCWIAKFPAGCTTSWDARIHGGVADCERGDNGDIFQWAFFYVPLWALIVMVFVAMTQTYRYVRRAEVKVATYRDSARSRSKARQVFQQARLYAGVFVLTWFFGTVNRIVQQTADESVYALVLLHSFFVPLQGFLNFIVFLRPRFQRYSHDHPDEGLWTRLRAVLRCRATCLGRPLPALERVSSSRFLRRTTQSHNAQRPQPDGENDAHAHAHTHNADHATTAPLPQRVSRFLHTWTSGYSSAGVALPPSSTEQVPRTSDAPEKPEVNPEREKLTASPPSSSDCDCNEAAGPSASATPAAVLNPQAQPGTDGSTNCSTVAENDAAGNDDVALALA